jgi:hypothetical protein
MSFTDRLVLWLHIGFAIFTIGPLALAISSTPRYIRRREVPVLRYLSRMTLIFTAASLLVLVFGIVLGQLHHEFSRPWLTISMTLFVVAIVLLVLVIRDQRRAIKAVLTAQPPAAAAPHDSGAIAADSAAGASAPGADTAGSAELAGEAAGSAGGQPRAGAGALAAAHIASVERGRIAALGGIVNLIWLAILVLMVWRP